MVIIVVMQSYVSKRCPKNVRGMVYAVIGILSSLGSILYLQTYNVLVQFGQFMAFGTVAIIDLVWLIFLLVMIVLGKYG
jgi:hypothetical protein